MLMLAAGCAGLLAIAPGCGDDDDGGDDSSCGVLAESLCDKSCDCSADCRIRFPSGGTQGFGNEIEAPAEQCTQAFTNSCEDPGIDVEACTGALPAAECTGDGSDAALALPEECVPE
jgi:hypothetical protein